MVICDIVLDYIITDISKGPVVVGLTLTVWPFSGHLPS